MDHLALNVSITPGAEIQAGPERVAWGLTLPAGPGGHYRLAQLDNYRHLSRRAFPCSPPLSLSLRARASAPNLPGTWGFGLWNDPFSLNLGFAGGARRFPALPNAAWFFHASPENHLSFRDDQPGHGFLAQTFRSPALPAPLLGLGAAFFPLLYWPWMARRLRSFLARIIHQQSLPLRGVDPTQWHSYNLQWETDQVIFRVDGQILGTVTPPKGPLGLVLWIDNQFVAFPQHGRLSFGTLANPRSAWLEVKELQIQWGKSPG